MEVTLLLALIAGGLLLALSGLQKATQGALRATASHLAADAPTETHLHKTHAPSDLNDAGETDPAISWLLVVELALLITVVGSGGVSLVAMHRWRVRTAKQESLVQPQHVETPVDVVFRKRAAMLKRLNEHMAAVVASQMEVHHVMTNHVETIRQDAKVSEAREVMTGQNRRHLMVCDDDQKLLGVLSDRDLIGRDGLRVREVMAAEPVTVAAHTQLDCAITLLLQKRFSCLPVVDHERLVGVVTTTDVMLAMQCLSQLLHRSNEALAEQMTALAN